MINDFVHWAITCPEWQLYTVMAIGALTPIVYGTIKVVDNKHKRKYTIR